MRAPATLTSRLVVITVALVAGAALLIGATTTLAMRDQLTNRLDRDIRAALGRVTEGPSLGELPPGPPIGEGPDADGPRDVRGQQVGTLTVVFGDCGDTGFVITDTSRGPASRQRVSGEVVDQLGMLEDDGQIHELSLPGIGRYRVLADEAGNGCTFLVGLPTESVDDAITSLIWWELFLGSLAVVVAGGLAVVVVRRQLRPLREVAATAHEVAGLPLSSGEIGVTARVPETLTDERTEVGQVGAALNTLLAHVEASLEARQRSEEQVRQFVADASHELRTPLATITGYAELARRRPDDAEALRTAMAKVDTESARMAALVEDLLLLARLDAGRPLASESVDLSRMLAEAVNDARILGPDHTWRLELPPDGSVEVTGDEHRLHQVITNLLANARKHTPPGTTVTVAVVASGFETVAARPPQPPADLAARPPQPPGAVITVHDDGPGFPPELATEAFTRFTRGDVARTRSDAGAGLGLSLVQAIVEAHGGTVTLDSRPGSTTIQIELPDAPAHA